MANRLYNKQVTPKGYKAGGRTGKMGGGMMMKRPMMKKGGPLKPVDPKTQKGLSKLPTEVRNKMGYMKDGGKVKKGKKVKPLRKSPKPGTYDYYLLNKPKHSPAPIKPKPKG